MARARNIKPSFFTNDKLAEIDPLGRLLFQGLWCLADREGRLEDRPRRIKAELLPYDNCDVDSLMQALHEHGFILRYASGGHRYIQVIKFSKHQHPHIKEGESTIPAPDSPGASTGNSGTSPADCGLLIPDCGLPSTPLSVSPEKPANHDVSAPKEKNKVLRQQATALVDFLNSKAGRHYRSENATTLEPVIARLREGYTPDECRAVIARKCRDWKGDDRMDEFLRPATLFGKEKFSQYVGEVPPETADAMP